MHKQLLVAIITLFISIPTSLSAQSTKAYRPSPKGPSMSLKSVVGQFADRDHFYFLDSDKESFLNDLDSTVVWLREVDEIAINEFKDSQSTQFPSGVGPVVFERADEVIPQFKKNAAAIIRDYYGGLWNGYPLFAWYFSNQEFASTVLLQPSQRTIVQQGPHFRVSFLVSYDQPTYKSVATDGQDAAVEYVPFFDPNLDDEKCVDEDTAPCWVENSRGEMKACCESQVVRYYIDMMQTPTLPQVATPTVPVFNAISTSLPGFLRVAATKDAREAFSLALPVDTGRAFYINYENYQPGVNLFIPNEKGPTASTADWQIAVTMQGINRTVTAANFILPNDTLKFIKATNGSLLLTSGRQPWRGANPSGLLLLLKFEKTSEGLK